MAHKKWLADLHHDPVVRTRRIQLICYLSLVLNMITIFCLLLSLFYRR